MVFHLKNCRFKIEYSFLLIIAFSLLLNTKDVLYVLLFASLHEIGHLITLFIFGFYPDEIKLSFYGIAMKHSAKMSKPKEIIFLFSGAAVNLLFAALNVKRYINIPLAVINLLPAFPLDGGRIVSLIFGYKTVRVISVITFAALLIFSFLSFNVSLMLISVYIIIFSYFEGIY